MPLYEYGCKDCSKEFEVVKSFKEYDSPQACPSCQSLTTERFISRSSFYGAGGWDSVAYNPGLGMVTKNTKHAEQIAKSRGLIPIGNEDLEKTMASQERKQEAIIEQSSKPAYDALEHGIKTEYLAKR